MGAEPNTENFYDKLAESYKFVSESKQLFNTAIDAAIIGARAGKLSTRMLDIGSGNGLRARHLSELLKVEKLFLSDVSSRMIELCRINAPRASLINLKHSSLSDTDEMFDCVTMQWNVLGHVDTFEQRVNLLGQCKSKLASGGQIFIDVNNRHNIIYGKGKVFFRYIHDGFWPDFQRGDTVIEKVVDDQIVRGFGHLFTVSELKHMFRCADLEVNSIRFFDYDNGSERRFFFQGQIFCVLS